MPRVLLQNLFLGKKSQSLYQLLKFEVFKGKFMVDKIQILCI